MNRTYPLRFEKGHLFIELDAGMWLLDTGAPSSFGTGPLIINGERFIPSTGQLGLDAETLSQYVQVTCAGLIGADVLNRFDHLFDADGQALTISSGELSLDGEAIDLELFMGIPIVTARVAGCDHRMFFDTGAQLSYLEDGALTGFPGAGSFEDFYPGVGPFRLETYQVAVTLGGITFPLRAGALPTALGLALMMANTTGIVGNAILGHRVVGYFPRRRRMVL